MNGTILLIDDEEKLRSLLKRILSLEGYVILEASTLQEGRKWLQGGEVEVVLCDVKLPDGSGVDFVVDEKKAFPQVEFILLTAFGNIPEGVRAVKGGAYDYLVKGDDNERILPLLSKALEKVRLERRVSKLESQLSKKYGFETVIGTSPALRQAVRLGEKVATADTSVLLTGETGTGKEVFAQSIHLASLRGKAAFVALNCSAFGNELLESELFGHKAGSFTGAMKDQKGHIEEARGGTLFLDEIGEMPLELQPKLLRFLETGTYHRVGDSKLQKADVRIIAATNRDLKAEVDTGRFRSDLYYRIAVFVIELPSLKDRREDIHLLAEHYLNNFAAKSNKRIKGFSPEVLKLLQNYPWKGNVRELKNVIERAVLLEDAETISPISLPPDFQLATATDAIRLADAERLHILAILRRAGGNKTEAARLLDIGLATLYRKLEEYGKG